MEDAGQRSLVVIEILNLSDEMLNLVIEMLNLAEWRAAGLSSQTE